VVHQWDNQQGFDVASAYEWRGIAIAVERTGLVAIPTMPQDRRTHVLPLGFRAVHSCDSATGDKPYEIRRVGTTCVGAMG